MKKFYKAHLLGMVCLSAVYFLGTSIAVAQTTENRPQTVILASVNIYNAEIIAQHDNEFTIGFDITNGKGTQPDVLYGVQLIKRIAQKKLPTDPSNAPATYLAEIYDTKVFNESLLLDENHKVTKIVTYKAPSSLSGEYELWLFSRNSSGFPFSQAYLGKVTLKASEGVSINAESCTVVSDGNKEVLPLTKSFSIDPSSKLTLTCGIKNISSDSATVTPRFDIRYRSEFGQIIKSSNNEPIVIPSGVSKTVSYDLPGISAAQVYNAQFSFVDEKKQPVSNTISFYYNINGDRVTIEQLILDKNSYASGDTAAVSMTTSGISANTQNSVMNLSIVDALSNANCAQQVSKPFMPGMDKVNLSISKSCQYPKVIAQVKVGEKIIAEKTFTPKEPHSTSSPVQSKNTSASLMTIVGIGIVVLLIIGLYVKRKKTTTSLPLVVLLILTGYLVSYYAVSAGTVWNDGLATYSSSGESIYGGVPYSSNQGTVGFSVDGKNNTNPKMRITMALNKATYLPGEEVIVTISVLNEDMGFFASQPFAMFYTDISTLSTPSQYPVDLNDPSTWSRTTTANYPYWGFNSSVMSSSIQTGYICAACGKGLYAPVTPGTYYINTFSRINLNPVAYAMVGYMRLPVVVVAPNLPPTVPTCTNPATGATGTNYPFTFSATDPDGDWMRYEIDWDNDLVVDEVLPPGTYVRSTPQTTQHSWPSVGIKAFRVRSIDDSSHRSNWRACSININIDNNQAPNPPTITGPVTGFTGTVYGFNLQSRDPDGDNIYYQVDWDNNGTFDQRAPGSSNIPSNTSYSVSRSWPTLGAKTFQARAIDIWNHASAWTPYTINIGNRPPNTPSVNFPATGYLNVNYTAVFWATDPDSNILFYQLDNNNDSTGDEAIPVSGYVLNGTARTKVYSFPTRGMQRMQVRAADVSGTNNASPTSGPVNPVNTAANSDSGLSPWKQFQIDILNRVPTTPTITVPQCTNTYLAGSPQSFIFKSTDPDAVAGGDQIKYVVDWGDGRSDTTFAYASGVDAPANHTYAAAGDYTISVIARDTYTPPGESGAATKTITVLPAGTPQAGICSSGGTTYPVYATCTVNNPTPVAYDDVVTWTASMGGVQNITGIWGGNRRSTGQTTSFSGTGPTISTRYTELGSKLPPILTIRDATSPARVARPTCPGIEAQIRPINLRVKVGKTKPAVDADTNNTLDTSGEVTVYLGSKVGLKTVIGGGMLEGGPGKPIFQCSGTASFSSHDPALKPILINEPVAAHIADPYSTEVRSATTGTYNELGDFPYTVSCTDSEFQSATKTGTTHVVPKPDFQEF